MKRPLIALVVVAVVAAIAVVAYLGRPESAPTAARGPGTSRILIVGIDSLDWERVNRLADEGRMPNLERMRREGSSGLLKSIHPFVSPTVWTTIATGKNQEKHGIDGFVVNTARPGEEGLSTSNMRRAKAIWQILSAAERTVGVIGWLVTYPADTVNGYLISSHVTLALSSSASARAPNQTDEWLAEGLYPREAWDEVAANVLNEDSVPDTVIRRFVDRAVATARREERVRTESLARFYASDLTSLTLARHFFDTRPADFAAVYFRGCDMASHFFWRFMDPESWGKELSPEAVSTFSPVVDRYYAFADSLLGEMLDLVDENTNVLLISDHGFAGHRGYRGFDGDVAVGTQMHRADGIVFMVGPDIARGGTISGATVLDVAPTVLALAGLPVGRDMDGRPLTEALAPTFLEHHPVGYIETYESAGDVEGDLSPVESPVDDEIKEQLRSLGYID